MSEFAAFGERPKAKSVLASGWGAVLLIRGSAPRPHWGLPPRPPSKGPHICIWVAFNSLAPALPVSSSSSSSSSGLRRHASRGPMAWRHDTMTSIHRWWWWWRQWE